MTKKHFVAVASIVRESCDPDLVEAFVAFFAKANPHFSADRFRDACRKEEEKASKKAA
jgi:hypothetical protein